MLNVCLVLGPGPEEESVLEAVAADYSPAPPVSSATLITAADAAPRG